MKGGPALDNLVAAIAMRCEEGLAPDALREAVLSRLRRAVPFDAAFWATVDPTTLLFTQPRQEGIPPETIPYFVQNEFVEDDVNKWTALARDRSGVGTLADRTAGHLTASARFRDIFGPLGLGDELRAVLRVDGACWGYLCLHRESGAPFSEDEKGFIQRVAPAVAEGIRSGILIANVEQSEALSTPGLVVVGAGGEILSATGPGEMWLEELGSSRGDSRLAPPEIAALTASMSREGPHSNLPRLRVRTPSGAWAVLHAARMPAGDEEQTAVIIERPSPSEVAPILMMAYGLTSQERAVTELVCRGLSSRELAGELHITAHTVQDHLKAIFEKVGVRSRRELVTVILQQQYLPRAASGAPLAPGGFYRDA